MMKLIKILPLLVFLISGCNSNGVNVNNAVDYDGTKQETTDQFNFAGNYIPPELKIDGLKEDDEWNNASSMISFGSQNQASVVLYRGESALFCFFDVKDNDIQTVGNNNGDDVTHGDSVEIYFDFKNDAAGKPQTDDIQINIGAHGKTRIFVGSNGSWGSWNGLLDYEIHLNGTLNDATDEDSGYTVELMIPYAQVGIDKNSTYGVAFGHVARGKDSTHETLQYTWGGLVFEGSFVDPQVPNSYIVSVGKEFYSRSNLPMGDILVNGTIYDQDGNPLNGVKVSLDNNETITNEAGKYTFESISTDKNYTLTLSKDGYKTYSKTILSRELKTDIGRVNLDYCLIKNGSTKISLIKGVVKNPAEGAVGGVSIKVGENETTTNSDGSFELNVLVDNDLEILLSKENYKDSVTTLNALDLAKNSIYDIGTVSLYSPSSNATFGGARGITACDVEIYRGFEGVNFLFKTKTNVVNGDHIELFIDAKTSFYGRDSSDYRIDFKGDGGISIVNFGNGSNNVVSSSGITNNAYLKGDTYYIEAMVPYSFLGVSEKDIIGISFGMWSESLKDWDGWDFGGYVAPEYSSEYCRIGLDNGLYRASSNDVKVTKVYGKVLDVNNNPIKGVTLNSVPINDDGSYSMYYENGKEITLTFSANGYISKSFTLTKDDLNGTPYKLDVTLSLAEAQISGTCNVDGVKVYLESDPNVYTYTENGTYSILVPTSSNAYLIFEKDGYKTVRKGFGMAALIGAANQGTAITYNVVMEAN